jgi:hypothetical protein
MLSDKATRHATFAGLRSRSVNEREFDQHAFPKTTPLAKASAPAQALASRKSSSGKRLPRTTAPPAIKQPSVSVLSTHGALLLVVAITTWYREQLRFPFGYETHKRRFCRFCRPSAGTFPKIPIVPIPERCGISRKRKALEPPMDGTWAAEASSGRCSCKKRHYRHYRKQSAGRVPSAAA